MIPVCPRCGVPARPARGRDLSGVPDTHGDRLFYVCPSCDARVGCHRDGRPLGTLAGPRLRAARRSAHAAFDPLWQSGRLTRAEAYAWLAARLGLPLERTHIGEFDEDLCFRVVTACTTYRLRPAAPGPPRSPDHDRREP